jgi:hypothetical protein
MIRNGTCRCIIHSVITHDVTMHDVIIHDVITAAAADHYHCVTPSPLLTPLLTTTLPPPPLPPSPYVDMCLR